MIESQYDISIESQAAEAFPNARVSTTYYDGETITDATRDKRIFWVGKRVFDIIMSAMALIVLSPLMACIAIAVFFDDPKGSPIYKQKRCGRHGEEFMFYKFRSMCVDADKMLDSLRDQNEMTGPVFKIRNDPRITRVGRFIRKTSLDELPQFFNVLKGDMSIIGPRPPLPSEVAEYTGYQHQRLWITPGISCIWQVQADRNGCSFEEWVEYDLKYLEERSWWLDLELVFRTVVVMMRSKGV